MEFYRTLKDISRKAKKIAAVGLVATLPYVCQNCSYIATTSVPETSQTQEVGNSQTSENLEAVVKN